MEEFGNHLMMRSSDRGTYVADANTIKGQLQQAHAVYKKYYEGELDDEQLAGTLRELGLWKTKTFEPHRAGFCRLVRGLVAPTSSCFDAINISVSAFHSGNPLFPVKSYSGSADDAYREAASDGTMWKGGYGRSRLRALQALINDINKDILDPVRRAPESAEAEEPEGSEEVADKDPEGESDGE